MIGIVDCNGYCKVRAGGRQTIRSLEAVEVLDSEEDVEVAFWVEEVLCVEVVTSVVDVAAALVDVAAALVDVAGASVDVA